MPKINKFKNLKIILIKLKSHLNKRKRLIALIIHYIIHKIHLDLFIFLKIIFSLINNHIKRKKTTH
jgi:hypothetical protein